MLDKTGVVRLVKLAYRSNHDVDDPLYLMILTIPQLFNDNFPLYIKYEDLSKIVHGRQCLSIFVIHLVGFSFS